MAIPAGRESRAARVGAAAWAVALALVALAGPLALAQPGPAAPAQPAADPSGAEGADDADAPPKPARKPRLSSNASERKAERQTIRLTVGENYTADVDFDLFAKDNQIAVSNSQIVGYVKANIGGKSQLVLTPAKKGETTITLRDPEGAIRLIYTVIITDSNLSRRMGELKYLLRDIEGLEIKIVGTKIVLDGEILVPNDYARMLGVIQDDAYAKITLPLATLSPLALQVLAQKIKQDVNAFAPDVYTRVVNGLVFIEGSVDSQGKANRVLEVARLYLPEALPGNPLALRAGESAKVINRELIRNFLVVNAPQPKKQEKLLRVTIHFVKLSKEYLRSFGFRWMPLYTGNASISVGTDASGAPGASSSSLTATLSNLLPKLNAGQAAGYVKVLRTGTVIVRSGEEASLSEKNSVPFLGLDSQGRSSSGSVNVGVNFSVTPQIIGQSEDILMKLDLQQSSVDQQEGNAQPSTSTHEVKTKIYVKNNESAAIAAIGADDVKTEFNKDRDPAAADGSEALFVMKRSKAYTKKKSQYVIFVTPQIVENASDGTEDLKKNFRVKVK